MVLKVTKSIDFAMLLVRVGPSINPKNLLTRYKTMIMRKIKKINGIFNKKDVINFIKSIALGVTFVERDGPTSDYKV